MFEATAFDSVPCQ